MSIYSHFILNMPGLLLSLKGLMLKNNIFPSSLRSFALQFSAYLHSTVSLPFRIITRRNEGTKDAFSRGLTLVELIVTITIISISFVLLGSKLGLSNFWKEEAFLRKFRETITFLHQQAVVDQSFYRLDFNFQDNSYKVSAINASEHQLNEDEKEKQLLASGVGYLTQELSLIISPALGQNYQLVSPPSFPSLAEKIKLPPDMSFDLIKTQRGEFTDRQQDQAYILFSPRGYTEFAVIYLNQGDFGKLTIFVNPFSGNTELYREHKEFDWNYSKIDKNAQS